MSRTPSPGGRCESRPFPALSDRCTCRRRGPNRRRTSIGSCPDTAAWDVSSTRWGIPSSASRSWFEWNVTDLPPTRTGNMFSTATATPVRSSTSGKLVDQPAAERALPPIRRVDDHDGDVGVGRRLDGAIDLPDRVGAPDLPRQQQARRVERADLETELVGERSDPARILALRILRDHDLRAAVAALGHQAEGPRQRPCEEGGRREKHGRGSHRTDATGCPRTGGAYPVGSCGCSRSPRRSWRSPSQRRSPGGSPGAGGSTWRCGLPPS